MSEATLDTPAAVSTTARAEVRPTGGKDAWRHILTIAKR